MTSQTEILDVRPLQNRVSPYVFKRHDDLLDVPVDGGKRDHWSISNILDLFPTLPTWAATSKQHGHKVRITGGGRMILEWLESHPGNGWQERWVNSGADSSMDWVDALAAADSRNTTARRSCLGAGLSSLLLCQVVFPSDTFLHAYKASALYSHARKIFRPDLFALLEARSEELNIPPVALKRALVVVGKFVLHTGRNIDQLTSEDVLAYRTWVLRQRQGSGMGNVGMRATWRRGPRRRKPAKLHADKAYDQPDLRRWVRDRGIKVRIARKGVESSQKLGKHRWVIERTMAWFTGYRRLTLRYERKAEHFLAFLILGASLTCYKKLRKLTT